MSRKRPEDWAALDDEALARIVTGSADAARVQRATEELLGRYRERIYRWCRRSTQEHESALDLAQDVLLRVHRALPRFDERAQVATWIFAITRNACISAARRRRPETEDDAILEAVASSDPDPERALLEGEAERRLDALIRATLSAREQDALWMRCVERRGLDEIERTLGLTAASGARSLLQNARRKLRAALARQRDEENRT